MLETQDTEWDTKANRICYLATPPTLVEHLAKRLDQIGLCKHCGRDRLVVEKPFGHDLASARELDRFLTGLFDESQIYRIDHYLGKETVQNILAFRFANALFEPIWDRRYIDHVQITVAETVGVGHRGAYYDHAGALRDMVQNHLLQLFCLIAMETPVSFDADEIRNKKVDVLRAVRPIRPEEVHHFAVRGQYGKGKIDGKTAAGLPHRTTGRSPIADRNLRRPQALHQQLALGRGSLLPAHGQVSGRQGDGDIDGLPARPASALPPSAVENWQPNRLVIRIQPEEGILMRVQAKQPGTRMVLGPVDLKFLYEETFKTTSPAAYETLLLDVMRGDATLFMRADQVETAWSVISPILEAWQATPPADFPDYPAGSWGPETADQLITKDGRNWLAPLFAEE